MVQQLLTDPIVARVTVKDTLGGLLRRGDLEAIASLATQKRRVLSGLLSWTYDTDPLIAWRAIEAMGLAAERIVATEPGKVREHLRRFLWLLSDESGGVCWRAPEGLAEIVSRLPDQFPEYIPITVSLIDNIEPEDLPPFLPGTLWAIGKLAFLGGEHINDVFQSVISALVATDSQVRGMAVWCLQELGRIDIISEHGHLLTDDGPVEVYEDRHIHHTTVKELAAGAISGSRTTH